MRTKQEWRAPLQKNEVGTLPLPPLLADWVGGVDSLTGRPFLKNTLIDWLRRHTFAPRILAGSLRHPLIAYLVAVLIQILTITVIALLLVVFPSVRLSEALGLLSILLVALWWGAGPGIVAVLTSVMFFMLLFHPPYVSPAVSLSGDRIGIGLYLIVGLAISVLVSQVQQARYLAETLTRRLIDVLDTIPEPVVIYDRSGNSIHVNQIARAGSGAVRENISLSEVTRALKLRSIEGGPLACESLPLARALRGEMVQSIDLAYTPPGGQHERFASVSAAPLRSHSSGEIQGAVTVTRDITALYQAQWQAAERAQQLEAIFEAITDGIFILRREEGTIPQLNRAAWGLLGFSEIPSLEDFPSSLPFEVLGEDGLPLSYEEWPEKLVREGMRLQGDSAPDIILRTKDGQVLSLSVTGGPLYDTKGQINGGVLVCRDVTEHRMLARRVQQSLDALLQMAQVVVRGPDSADEERGEQVRSMTRTIAQHLAEQARQVLGCERLSLSGVEPDGATLYPLAVTGLSPEDERAWWISQEQDAGNLASSPDPVVAERLRRNEILILDYSQPPWSEQPNPFNMRQVLIAPIYFNTRLLGLLTLDHGGREHSYTNDEIAMTRAITQLIALVIEREHLLTQQAETRANLMALRNTNRMMDEFIGIAGHELRTPLTTVRASVQLAKRQLKRLLRQDQLEQEQIKRPLLTIDGLLERTERQVRMQNRLINDLLDVSRLRTDRLELHPELCDLAALLEEAIEDQRSLTPTRTIHLALPAQSEVLVMADADRIRQVITNYLSNALKYSEPEKAITVRLEVLRGQARLSVEDQGPGLSKEQSQRIWERFYRVPEIEVKSGSGVGLGLGLHISRMIIERQDGRVGVQSVPGKGSTFWFSLPLAEGESAHHEASSGSDAL